MGKTGKSMLKGIILLLIGIWIIGGAVGVWDFVLFKGWWTLFLIVPAVLSMIDDGISLSNSIVLGVGIVLLMEQQKIFQDINLWLMLLGIVILVAGFKYLFGHNNNYQSGYHNCHKDKVKVEEEEKTNFIGDINDSPVYFSIASGVENKNSSNDLKKATVVAIAAGAEIDFSQARVNRDIEITLVAIAGGIDIIAPRGVRILVKGVPILGGYDNLAPSVQSADAPIVTINCITICGAAEIK